MSKYIGIDGGISGAISILLENKVLDILLMPVLKTSKSRNEYDCQAIIEILIKHPDAIVCLEKAQAMPVLGTVQAFRFGQSYGTMIGILSTLKMKYHLIAARTWQREMFKDMNYNNTKEASAIVAKQLFPEQSFLPTERTKKIHSGMTDSILIAEYARRHNL